MTREEKSEMLDECCHFYGKCDNCELRKKYDKETDVFTDEAGCVFDEMSDDMLNKCYNWYKELDPAACENAEDDCCDIEPDDLNPHIEPKVARHYEVDSQSRYGSCRRIRHTRQLYERRKHCRL